MSAGELSRFDELMSRHLDDELADSEVAELLSFLAEPTLTARFLEVSRLNSEIAGLLAAPVPDAAMVELVRADIEKGLPAAQAKPVAPLRIVKRAQPRVVARPSVLPPGAMPPRPHPALRALAWAAVILVLAGLTALFLVDSRRRAGTPAIASVQGEVRLVGTDGERVLKPGEVWKRGDTLKTIGAKSAATVTFDDGTRLAFAGDSVAVNKSGADGRRVELERGDAQCAIKQQPARQAFVFATPDAEAVVVGTTFQVVTIGAHQTRVVVTEGNVLVKRRSDGAEIMIRAGFHVLVAPKRKLTADPNQPKQRPR